MNIVFQIQKWREYYGRFTDIVILNTNDSYLLFLTKERDEKRGPWVKLQDNFWNHACSILWKRSFDIEKALEQGHFCSFAQKSRGLDTQDRPICAPAL